MDGHAAAQSQAGERAAIEGVVADPGGIDHRSGQATGTEGIIPDVGHAGGDCHTGQAVAVGKRRIANADHAAGNDEIAAGGGVGGGAPYQLSQVFIEQDAVQASIIRIGGVHIEALKVIGTAQRTGVEGGDTAAEGHVGQGAHAHEHRAADVGNAVGNNHVLDIPCVRPHQAVKPGDGISHPAIDHHAGEIEHTRRS